MEFELFFQFQSRFGFKFYLISFHFIHPLSFWGNIAYLLILHYLRDATLVYRHKEYCRYVWQSCRTSKTASSPPNAVRICSENSIMIFLSFLDTQLASFGFYYQQNFSFVKGVFLKKNEKRVQAERHGFRNRKSWNPGKYKCERGSSVPEAGSHARLPFLSPSGQ